LPEPTAHALRSIPKTVPARYYNRVRLALIRLGNPLRVPLHELGQAEMLLADEAWLCVDASRNDLPLMAWRDFAISGRDALHEPVHCTLELYHTHAGILLGNALRALDEALAERLQESPQA
jgi:hypothetical protein